MSKKIFAALIIFIVSGSLAFADLTISLGFDANGFLETLETSTTNGGTTTVTEGSDDPDAFTTVFPGLTISADYTINIAKILDVGAGIEYMINRRIKSSSANEDSIPEIGFLPIFAIVRVPFKIEGITFIPVGKIGYSFFFADEDYTSTLDLAVSGGLYWAAGLGFGISKNIMLELTYCSVIGYQEYENFFGTNIDTIQFSVIRIALGITLDF